MQQIPHWPVPHWPRHHCFTCGIGASQQAGRELDGSGRVPVEPGCAYLLVQHSAGQCAQVLLQVLLCTGDQQQNAVLQPSDHGSTLPGTAMGPPDARMDQMVRSWLIECQRGSAAAVVQSSSSGPLCKGQVPP